MKCRPSAPSSLAAASLTSGSSGPASIPAGSASGTRGVPSSCACALPAGPSTATRVSFREMLNGSTSLQAGSPASPFPSPASGAAPPTSDGCGRHSPTPFAYLTPDGSWSRTSLDFFSGDSPSFSGTWPRSGVMRAGRAFERPTSEPRTSEPASGSWLPTPARSSYGSNVGGSSGRVGPTWYSLDSLARMGALLPTPTRRGNYNRAGLSERSGDGLATAIARLLPTPTVMDARKGYASPPGEANDRGRETRLQRSGERLPTPVRSQRGDRGSGSLERGGGRTLEGEVADGRRGSLSPWFVEWMMGAPQGWTDASDARPSETPLCRSAPSLSGGGFSR